MQTITVFGSSQVKPHSPEYQAAERIGRGLARAGFAVMSGGYLGLMEAVSKGASAAGGHVIGVTTDQIGAQFAVQPNPFLDEVINFADLRDRLQYMVLHGDAYLALPGGIGTLHEIAETWELMRIGGIPSRPFLCYGAMWAELIGKLQASGYLGPGYHGMISFADQPADALAHLKRSLARAKV